MANALTQATALALSGLQLAVFEYRAQGIFTGVNALPAWFSNLVPADADIDHASCLTDHFPALEGFLPLAEEFWTTTSTEALQSDFWTETDAQGTEYHLLAFAVTAGSRHFLVLERADATYVEHQQLQLYAHEMNIQYDTIAKLNEEVQRATRAKSDFLAT